MNIQKGNMNRDLPFWEPVRLDDKLAVRLFCPSGNAGFLDHNVDGQGRVTPSVECPDDRCTFHESGITLEGYTLPPITMEDQPA